MSLASNVALLGGLGVVLGGGSAYFVLHPIMAYQRRAFAEASAEGRRRVRSGAVAIFVVMFVAFLAIGFALPRSR
jgi:hypothetical protein